MAKSNPHTGSRFDDFLNMIEIMQPRRARRYNASS